MPRPTVAPLVLRWASLLLAGWLWRMPHSLVVGGRDSHRADWRCGSRHCCPAADICTRRSSRRQRRRQVAAGRGTVERCEQGMPGYRLRLPEKVHPISAGIKGGSARRTGDAAPALAYGLLSGHGIWYPVNLLAGHGAAGRRCDEPAELEQFHLRCSVVGVVHSRRHVGCVRADLRRAAADAAGHSQAARLGRRC